MKVILTQPVQGLGEAGAIKEVADGYARNYLLPRKLAVAATKGSVKQAEAHAELYARRASKALTEVQKAAAGVTGKVVTIRARAGSENRLYGSVTAADVADALQQQYGITIDRRKIELGETIHRLGTYSAAADMGSGVNATFSVEVAPEVAGAHGKASTVSGTAPAEEATEPTASEDDFNAEPATEEEAQEGAEANPS
ncbi:MAG TPA: 50S ribosomal protein L9 [Chloroflexia bacterium]|nr:50S ribosomal protein L9 [Chloroflexia bacterium]